MLYRQIEQNRRKTVLLVLLFGLLVLATGAAIGYLDDGDPVFGLVLAAIFLAFYLPFTWLSASRQVLGMAGARPVSREEYPQLYNIVEELCIPARLPMPKIYIVDDPSPNAFATGLKPEKGAVAFTTGLLERLNREELEGVAAHELAHIRNYDIRLMTISIALISVIIVLADIGVRMLMVRRGGGNRKGSGSNPVMLIVALVLVILAPIAARIVHFAISRNREYLADATAVEFTRNPAGLKNALRKIAESDLDVRKAKQATAPLYFASPFNKERKKRRAGLFDTHPPIEARIERLERM